MIKRHPEYQYLNLLQEALTHGERKVDRGTGIVLLSLFGRQTRYDLSQGFPLLTTKKVYWKGVLHELYWFVSGQTNIKYLVDNNVHIWDDYPYKMYRKNQESGIRNQAILTKEEFIERIKTDEKFARKWGNLPKIYGEMWRHWPTRKKGRTIDQLAWAIQEMKDDPDAKNLIVNSWNPEYLYTMATYEDASRFPICHNMYQFSNRNGKLSLQLYQRSADLFLGVPFNIASYALLTIILAHITGLEPGEFIHTFGDVHIYENHTEQVKEQLTRKPRAFPTVSIAPSVKRLDDFLPEHVTLEGYDPYPTLKAELTIAGGLYDPRQAEWLDNVMKSIPTVGILIIEKNKVLLVKHGEKASHLTGSYGIPAGRFEGKETAQQAAVRELQEETGLLTTEDSLEVLPLKIPPVDLPRKDGSTKRFTITVFLCRRYSGKLQGTEETIPEWVSLKEIANYPLIGHTKQMVEEGRKFL